MIPPDLAAYNTTNRPRNALEYDISTHGDGDCGRAGIGFKPKHPYFCKHTLVILAMELAGHLAGCDPAAFRSWKWRHVC